MFFQRHVSSFEIAAHQANMQCTFPVMNRLAHNMKCTFILFRVFCFVCFCGAGAGAMSSGMPTLFKKYSTTDSFVECKVAYGVICNSLWNVTDAFE